MDNETFQLAQLIRDNANKLEFVYHITSGDDYHLIENGDTLAIMDPIEATHDGKVRIYLTRPED